MPNYCTSDDVLAELPENPPAEVTLKLAADIAEASDLIDASLGDYPFAYNSGLQRFPDVTDNPATPSIITLACKFLAASKQYVRLGQRYKNGDVSLTQIYESKGYGILKRIKKEEFTISIAGVAVAKTVTIAGVENKTYNDREAPKEFSTLTELDLHAGD